MLLFFLQSTRIIPAIFQDALLARLVVVKLVMPLNNVTSFLLPGIIEVDDDRVILD
jgi:hypothetical protein